MSGSVKFEKRIHRLCLHVPLCVCVCEREREGSELMEVSCLLNTPFLSTLCGYRQPVTMLLNLCLPCVHCCTDTFQGLSRTKLVVGRPKISSGFLCGYFLVNVKMI